MSWPTPAVTALILTIDKRVLLLEHSPGQWVLPGGIFEGGSDWTQNLSGTLRKSLGLEVKRQHLIGIYCYSHDPFGAQKHRATAAFLVSDYSGDVKSLPRARWFECTSLPPSLAECEGQQVRDAVAFRGATFQG